MPYTAKEAISTLFGYLQMNIPVLGIIPETSNRGYKLRLSSGGDCVVFVYPISHKQDDSKNFFDTRDSGARERGIAWNYAQQHNLKYFCLGVHDQVEKYKDYIFSLECDEHRIAEVSGTLNGSRNGRGTQVVIPSSCIPSKEFERIYTDNGFYIAVIHKSHIYEYLEQYDNRPYMDKTLPLVDTTDVGVGEQTSPIEQSPSFTPTQVIYYGVPGCGKSNKIKQDFENGNVDEEAQVVRCVFHPEYTNADFVGQIFPVVKKDGKGVDYKFKPGPFTEILRRAYLNPHTKFFLVIEEINRGNAAAIFGEMFQLLDRIKEGKDKSGFGPGWSSYSILNDDLNDYIRNIEAFDKFEHVGCVKPNLYKDMRDGNGNVVDAPDENGKKEIDFSTATSYSSLELTLQGFDVPQIFRESTSIRLPPNLSILATMNTSDQNVSTLDNAFQRRFDMELVRNEFESGDVEGFKTAAIKAQHDAVIEGASCTWGDFWENINKKIIQYNRGLASTEDKRLGPWFVCSVAGETGDGPRKIPAKTFTEKVLKYLWDDAFKFKRSQVFADGLSSLEQVVSAFEKADGEKLKAVFKEF